MCLESVKVWSGALASMHVANWPAPTLGPATLECESTPVVLTIQRRVHPAVWPQPAFAGGQMRSRLSSSRSFVFHRLGLRRGRRLICPLLTSPRYSAPISRRPASILRSTGEISRGKTRYLRCIDAGFTKCTLTADGGLRSHVPARPRCITPHIRFLFIAPQLRIGLPPDLASRRRPCPSPCLRLCENLAIGLSPTK